MRVRLISAQIAFLGLLAGAPLQAQKPIDLTGDMLDRFLKGADAENVETGKTGDQLRLLDEKIKKFQDCRGAFEKAQGVTDGKLNLAMRIAMRAKCGASDDGDMQKDRQKIFDEPTTVGASTAGMKIGDYRNLKDRITAFFGGSRSGFTKPGLDLLDSRQADVSKSLNLTMVQQSGGSSGGGMGHMPGMWTTDYAWAYIGQLFALQYASGASVFEQRYQPGEWTQWRMSGAGEKDVQTMERAFLAMQPDSSEWWRMKTLTSYKDNGKDMVDTVVIEALYKPTSAYTKELVRVRAKLPGNKDAQELMVPAGMGMVNYNGMLGSRPTKESIDGATIGTEKVDTKAGSFTARHVRYGTGGGTLDWWLTPDAPGGWVKFTGGSADKPNAWTIEMVAKGTGAKSELGVIK